MLVFFFLFQIVNNWEEWLHKVHKETGEIGYLHIYWSHWDCVENITSARDINFPNKKKKKKVISFRHESDGILFLFWDYETNVPGCTNLSNDIWFTLGWWIGRGAHKLKINLCSYRTCWKLLYLHEGSIIKHHKILIIPEAAVGLCCGW